MTFCLAMKVADGLVGIADTQVTTGTARITAKKVTVHERPHHAMFLMSSGLRSVRDKALTYFREALEERDEDYDKLYKVVNSFADQVRQVAAEDKPHLEDSGLSFDFHALVGGQLERDAEHKLYLLYPEGNWVEVAAGTPYFIIGEPAYGKPLLDRALRYESSMQEALKIGFLAFDATRMSATHVDFPADVVLYRRDSYRVFEHRFDRDRILDVSDFWATRLRQAIAELPTNWVDYVFRLMDAPSDVIQLDREARE